MEAEETEIKKVILNYLELNKKEYGIESMNDILLSSQREGGVANKNYKITIKNNRIHKEYFLFLKNSTNLIDFDNYETQKHINYYLSNKLCGPKLYYSSGKFQIFEFINESRYLTKEEQLENKTIDRIIDIFNDYSNACDYYKYVIINNKANTSMIKNNNYPININFYDLELYIYYPKAKKALKLFLEEYEKNKNLDVSERDKKIIEDLKYLSENYQSVLNQFFPQESYFVISSNDSHKDNILISNNKIYTIDNEYCCLNLIGFDFIHYLLSLCSTIKPVRELRLNEIDFKAHYERYLKFLEKFLSQNKEIFNETNKDLISILKSKKYFLSIICLVDLHLINICQINLNFAEAFKSKIFDAFNNFICRYNYCYNEFKKYI